MPRCAPAVAVVFVLLLVAAAPAPAGTVSVTFSGSGYRLGFEAAAGEANRVTLEDEPTGGGIRVVDQGAPLVPGENCAPAGDGRGVVCAVADERWIGEVSADLGDGHDLASARDLVAGGADVVLYGREGDDRLEAGAAGRIAHYDRQQGTFPNLVGGPGDDVLIGGAGHDQLDGGQGADVFRGGPGSDWVSYVVSPAAVTVSIDDRPGDGPPGENDNVTSDVEVVDGSPGDDVIVGSEGPDRLTGLGGSDSLDGRGGADVLTTDRGADRLVGGAGPDVFRVETFDDEFLETGVDARDGERDRVGCDARTVMLSADPFDSLSECAPAVARPRYSRLRVRRSGTATLLLGCQGHTDIPCAGKIRVRRESAFGGPSGPVIGRGRFRIPADGLAARATVRFTRPFMRLLASRGKIEAEASLITLRESPRSSRTVPMHLELLAPR